MRVLATISLIFLALGCRANTSTVSYEKLGLECPCEVVEWEKYLDGGSMGGLVRDSRGTELPVSWDWRMDEFIGADLQKPHLAYINADYPSEDGATALPLGSEAERQLLDVLESWAATQVPPDKQDRWLSIYFDGSIARTDRTSQLPPLSDSQERALKVLKACRYLRLQRELGHAPAPR